MLLKRKIVYPVALLIAVVMCTFAGYARYQNAARYWPHSQASIASGMGLRLHEYRVRHGVYPESLQALVDSGQMTADGLAERSFRARPLAKRQAWIYRKPSRPEDIAIISPGKAFASRGLPQHREGTITASADGSAWLGTQSYFGPGGPRQEKLAPLPD